MKQQPELTNPLSTPNTLKPQNKYRTLLILIATPVVLWILTAIFVAYIDYKAGYTGSEARLAAVPLMLATAVMIPVAAVSFIILIIRFMKDRRI